MIDFLKYRTLYLIISSIVIGLGLISIVTWGYRYSIDFVGGTNLDYRTSVPVTSAMVRDEAAKLKIEIVSERVTTQEIVLRTKAVEDSRQAKFKNNIEQTSGARLQTMKSETVGPTLGGETVHKTIIASLIAVVGILLYMAYAFRGFTFATAAIAALFHDFLVVMGMYSIFSHFFGAEFDTLFVTALLTTMSFSVHDTIIIFDKIREYKKTIGHGNIQDYANRALTETLIRSLNNSMTIIFMLLALTLMGGVTIRYFVAALLVGTITGAYSSPFVATPVWVWLEKKMSK